jgi:hypothetical protein
MASREGNSYSQLLQRWRTVRILRCRSVGLRKLCRVNGEDKESILLITAAGAVLYKAWKVDNGSST